MDNQSGEEIEVRDFADNSDISPVSDPHIFSETQRLAQAQAVLQMANSAPQLYDLRAAHRRVLKQLKVPAINEILPDPDGIKESNPALENVAMSMGRPAAAYPDQDHLAHIKVHLAYAQDPNYGGSPLIGPMFAPKALEHIKQHLTLHYLQSMRAQIASASRGEDYMKLHEERPLSLENQQALSLAAQLVSQDSQITFQADQPGIQQLMQKVQQMQQMQQQNAMLSDPTAQVLLKTQMAETQRKQAEFQQRAQLDAARDKQNYEIKIAQLEQKVQELTAKYNTEQQLDAQKNATDIALANINNASKERIAEINHGSALEQQQIMLQHEQDISAMEAIRAAEQDIRQHGLQVRQDMFQQEADKTLQQVQAANQAALAQQQHDNAMQQQQQAAAMQATQQPEAPQAPQQPQPPEGTQ